MIGIGPISRRYIEECENDTNDYKEAKVRAVKEFLEKQLKYDERELKEIKIEDTKVSASKDEIVYVVLKDIEDIKNIHRRKAECQNDNVSLRNFIPPPQFHARYLAINKVSAERRAEDDALKTQLRFGKADIEILIKFKGSNTPFKKVEINYFCDGTTIPEFDHTIKWKHREDRRPRRSISPMNEQPQSARNVRSQSPPNRQHTAVSKLPRLTRQHSSSSTNSTNSSMLHKKIRTSGSSDHHDEDPAIRNNMDTNE